MKIGFFGGSFDPLHRGHVEPVRAAIAEAGLDRVMYLPTAQPPHKPDRRFAPAHCRFAMVELALLAEPRMFASAHELTPGRPAYTVETLEHFRRELPAAELFLLVGADSFASFDTWRRWREIPPLATLLVMARPGWEQERLATVSAEVRALVASGAARLLHGEEVDLSSTEIRALLGRGEEPPPGALQPLVLDYVRKYALYR